MRPLAGGDSAFQHGGWKSFEAQTGPTGTVTGTRQYDAFGAQLASTGAWQGALAHGGGFGYQSDDTGLQLLGHRYYDPSIGRFLTRDPIKDGPNWYAYCLNDPVNHTDPTGLLIFIPYLIAVGVGVAVGAGIGGTIIDIWHWNTVKAIELDRHRFRRTLLQRYPANEYLRELDSRDRMDSAVEVGKEGAEVGLDVVYNHGRQPKPKGGPKPAPDIDRDSDGAAGIIEIGGFGIDEFFKDRDRQEGGH